MNVRTEHGYGGALRVPRPMEISEGRRTLRSRHTSRYFAHGKVSQVASLQQGSRDCVGDRVLAYDGSLAGPLAAVVDVRGM